jgi:P27 family predicted phage terminase small subunit
MPRRPALLTGEARLEWERQAPRLFRLGLLTELDGPVLTLYCQNWKRWLQAEAAVEATLEATGRLNRMRVLVAQRYGQAVLQLAGQLGLSPSARTRINMGDHDEDRDDLLGILS